MVVRIMETDPKRLREVARAWGVHAVEAQSPDVLTVAIAAAYRRLAAAEERAAMRLRYAREPESAA